MATNAIRKTQYVNKLKNHLQTLFSQKTINVLDLWKLKL